MIAVRPHGCREAAVPCDLPWCQGSGGSSLTIERVAGRAEGERVRLSPRARTRLFVIHVAPHSKPLSERLGEADWWAPGSVNWLCTTSVPGPAQLPLLRRYGRLYRAADHPARRLDGGAGGGAGLEPVEQPREVSWRDRVGVALVAQVMETSCTHPPPFCSAAVT